MLIFVMHLIEVQYEILWYFLLLLIFFFFFFTYRIEDKYLNST